MFQHNQALKDGGAIKYDFRRPTMLNNSFSNNTAQYGDNIASYAAKIVQRNTLNDYIEFNNIGSGVRDNQVLELAIVDLDNQIMNQDSVSKITITGFTPNSSLSGINSAISNQGVAVFDDVAFVYQPGSSDILYRVTSSILDSSKLAQIGLNDYSTISVSFRYCKPGESQDGLSSCITCAFGTYSTEWNSTS